MARRLQTEHMYIPRAQVAPYANGLPLTNDRLVTGDEEAVADVDEPPDERLRFPRLFIPSDQKHLSENGYTTASPVQHSGRTSLLTQALLTTPELTPYSDAETPVLTSDGGLTSPARTNSPSPSSPLPTSNLHELVPAPSHNLKQQDAELNTKITQSRQGTRGTDKPAERNVEAGLGRRRCITFACGRQGASSNNDPKPAETTLQAPKLADPPKRPCMLRFACPMKPPPTTVRKVEQVKKPSEPLGIADHSSPSKLSTSVPSADRCLHRSSASVTQTSPKHNASDHSETVRSGKPSILNYHDLESSEATRFYEFAGSFDVEDEWINEQTAHRQKITVNDTLRKENAIRRITQEAEEEALQEDGEDEDNPLDNLGNMDEGDQDSDSDEEASDGGNETDDEEGFADSDDDSDHGSQYHFWTPGLTTAATSVDHVEHIRPMTQRVPSGSSIESIINTQKETARHEVALRRGRKGKQFPKPPKMRPGTPDLPDSTDFVCGTLDEDRPLEAAYMSCLEERRRSRHKTTPQDIDPSFPTSDPDAEEDDEEEEDDDDDDDVPQPSDEPVWVTGQPDHSDEESHSMRQGVISQRIRKSPVTSPKYSRSPAPARRSVIHRSPPPRTLFGQSPAPLRSPPFHQKLRSPPSTRRTSFSISPRQKLQGIITLHLAQRPHLTHTTSLPRTPNPFWRQHREARGSDAPSEIISSTNIDLHSRGPIEIVKGLECRRQRRREKLWRLHCRGTGKEKERRCQPGKGAQRMRELGLEMANRAKDYGLKAEIVLSA